MPLLGRAALVCILAVSAAACEDPSNVGLGLIGDRGGIPVQRTLEPTDARTEHFRYVTGGNVGPFGEEVTSMLLGVVNDPQFGRTVVDGHANVQQSPFLPPNFRETPVTAARIMLRRNYLYGDTTSTIRMRLRDLTAPWEPSGARADTTLSVGGEITVFEFSAADTLVTIQMPDTWVEERNALLRESNETFRDNFHGFQFEAVDGNAVMGFSPSLLDLQVINESDTTVFPGIKVFSKISNDGNVNVPQDALPLQSGVGTTVAFDFDLGAVELSALNRVVLYVHPDSSSWAQGATETFVRTFPDRLSLFGITQNRGEVLLHTAEYDRANRRYVFTSDAFIHVMRDVFVGKDALERFVVRVPGAPLSINSIFIHGTDPERAPRLSVTTVPVD